MRLSEVCIKRPVFASVLNLLIIIFGLICYSKIPIRALPNIDPPVITVMAYYGGADASYIEKNITTPIEKVLRTLKGLDAITSSSSSENVNFNISFKLGVDLNEALNDVRAKISSVRNLPEDMQAPIIDKISADSWPSMWLAVSSDKYNAIELTDIIDKNIQPFFEKISYVGKVRVEGGRYYTMNIEPDPTKLYAFKISPMEIEKAILAQNADYPAGMISTNVQNFVIKLSGNLKHPSEFENIVLKKYQGRLIKISDVAKVELSTGDINSILKYNGKEGIAIGLVKASGANILDLASAVKKTISEVKNFIPSGIDIEIAFDDSVPVAQSISSVFWTIFESLILVTLVVYFFLRSIYVTFIPFVAIPISLIGTFSIIYALGFSINTFTLLAMILSIGLVVDDAIVVLENIFRYSEKGDKAKEAALNGSKEIGFAIITMTITLAAVFLPIGFVEGFLGKLFIEFAWTLAFCVIVSGFVSLTLTPMMASMVIDFQSMDGKSLKIVEKFQYFLKKLENLYLYYLDWSFKNQKKFWIICASGFAISLLSFIFITKEFVPDEDSGILTISAIGPESSNIVNSTNTMDEVEKIISLNNNISGYFTFVSDNNGFGFITLKPWDKRSKSQQNIQNMLNNKFKDVLGMSVFASAPRSLISGNSRNPVEFYISSDSDDWDFLDNISQQFLDDMTQSKIFVNLQRDLKTSTPTLDVKVDRDKTYLYDLSFDAVGRTLQYMVGGRQVGYFAMGQQIYDVMLRFDQNDRSKIHDLTNIYIKNNNGQMINIAAISKIEEKISIASYNHYDTLKAVTLSSDLSEGYNIQDAIKFIDQWVKSHNVQISYLGEIKQMAESNSGILYTFGVAIIFIYLVLSAQFESFKDPLLILMSVPFSITGALVSLLLFGGSINLYSSIGLVTLIGLVTKNSIMIIEFANQLRESGKNIYDAIISSAHIRFRPIMMTTTATICGAVPLLFQIGSNAEACYSIGLVIVGGMTIGTVFTLFIIPILYNKFKI